MVCRFGTVEHDDWDLDGCPVPIGLSQVKTDMAYTTFIDRDAVSYLRDYLRWVELESGGRPDPPGPLFTTRRGTPVSADWVSERFNRAASNAGIQKRIRPGVLGIYSHSVCHLLKSTLLVAGYAPYAADHILGHSHRRQLRVA